MPTLIHLIYASVATQEFSHADLEALLAQSRKANKETGLTGMLLYSQGSFFQVVEGEAEAVERLYVKLCADPRHTQLTVIVREPIARRSFRTWSMGFSNASSQELATIPGLNDFFQSGSCLQQLDAGRAKKLLSAFARGRWRSKLIGTGPQAE